jgi:hypothetical protein
MNPISIPKQVLAGFAVAVFALCVGVYFGTKLGGEDVGSFLLCLFYFLAAVATLKSIFEWGRIRGFPIRREDGRIHFGHVIRNLTMVVVVVPLLMILSGPFVIATFQLAR